MDIMSLILSCALVPADPVMLDALARHESFYTAYYVRPMGETFGVGYPLQEEGARAAQQVIAAGQTAFVGYMGLPTTIAPKFDLSVAKLIEPCTNVQVASVILDDLERECRAQGQRDVTACVLSRYAQLTGQEPRAFVEAVLTGTRNSLSGQRGNEVSAASPGSIFMDGTGTTDLEDAVFLDVDVAAGKAKPTTRYARELNGKKDIEAVQPPNDPTAGFDAVP
ncbi:MAG: hypothetical protein ACREUA_11470 [Burkholderiales bacterium]